VTEVARMSRSSGAPRSVRLADLTRHGLFMTVLMVGVLVRLASTYAFRPASGSGASAVSLEGLSTSVALQHLAGLLTGAVVYLVMLRWGVWRWLAALAAVPVLLGGRVVSLEAVGSPSTVLVLLVSAGLLLACWQASPPAGLVVAGVAFPVVGLLAWYDLTPGGGVVAATLDLVHGSVVGGDGWRGSVTVHQSLATALVLYGRVSQVAVAALVAALVTSLAAACGVGRAQASSMRVACTLTALLPVSVLAATAPGDVAAWGDSLTALVWWPAAGALGVTALLRGRRAASAELPQGDAVDREAQDAFDKRYDTPLLAPVVVVIAAYNEADGLPQVLAEMPDSVCGLPRDVLLVDDGSADDTAAVAEGTRAYVVRCSVNRGQGAALRLGYRIAREHGADYIITTDADGQYDVGDFPVVLAPVLSGRADFVTGSRRLGQQPMQDRFRRLGVHVFAWLSSALLGRRLTDTSFGLRAMHADVTRAVTLNQPQYQSAELLIGAVSHGFRVLEVPGTMHRRTAGSTKKGRDLVYGTRYAKVVLGTWWREGCPSPVAEHAPALRGSAGHADP
jgi:hypothetical protein